MVTCIYYSFHDIDDIDIDRSSTHQYMLLDEQPLDEVVTTNSEFSIEETETINSDDSYSSSFTFSDSDESDEFGHPLNPFASGVADGVKRVKILDPITDKLQSFLDSGVLSKNSMFYGCLKVL